MEIFVCFRHFHSLWSFLNESVSEEVLCLCYFPGKQGVGMGLFLGFRNVLCVLLIL